MEEAIEESLFGAMEAISPVILSMKLSLPIESAREALAIFYGQHTSKLSAAYCISGIKQGERVFQIVDSTNLESLRSEFQDASSYLYAVAPSNAADPVVLADLARKKQVLAATLSNKQLLSTGRLLNPLKIARDTSSFSENKEVPAPSSSSAAKVTQVSDRPQKIVEPVAADLAPKSVPQSSTEQQTRSVQKQAPKSTPKGSSFFIKGTREDAVKLATRSNLLQAQSKVVEAEDHEQDPMEDEQDVLPRASNKRQQLEKLKDMFGDEENIEMNDASDEEQGVEVVVAEQHMEDIPPEHISNSEPELANEPGETVQVENNSPPDVVREQSDSDAEPVASVAELGTVEEDSTPKRIIQEDGWIVSEYKPKTTNPKVQSTSMDPQSPAKTLESLKPKPKSSMNLPKIPARPGKNKGQKTLTSFFTKKS